MYEDPKPLICIILLLFMQKVKKHLSIIDFMFTLCSTVHELFHYENESK